MQKTAEKKRKKEHGSSAPRRLPWGLIIAASVPVLFLILYAIFSSSKKLADIAAEYFAAPIRHFLGTVFSVVPFSVMEIFLVLLGLGLIAFIAVSAVQTVRAAGRRLRLLGKRLFILLIVFLYICSGYFTLWGISHNGSSFAEKSSLESSGVLVEELVAVTQHFLNNANALADSVARDENGVFAESLDDIFSAYGGIYDAVAEEFPALNSPSLRPKRMYLFSELMSITGFTGIYFPFTGESNININAPLAGIPATIAHELAHQRGIASEAECNFVGIAASVTSGNTAYEYSGWYLGLSYLMNALAGADADAWRSIRLQFSEGLEADWSYKSAYWAAYESPVSEASAAAYDSYLKAHGHSDGIKSYGACVDLLVAYFIGKC